jgi:hypothetical protein
MKKIFTTITCLSVAAVMFANQPTQPKFGELRNAPTLKPTVKAEFDKTEAAAKLNARFAKPEAKTAEQIKQRSQPKEEVAPERQFPTNRLNDKMSKVEKTLSLTDRMDEFMPNPDVIRSKKAEAEDLYKWDSLQLIDDEGNLRQTMYLTYEIIDGLFWEKALTIYDWDEKFIVGYRIYDWHTEGPLKGKLKSQRQGESVRYQGVVLTDGIKETYSYNAQGLGDSTKIYWTDLITGNYVFHMATYVGEWDAAGNQTKSIVWQALIDANYVPTGEWAITSIQTATHHPDGKTKQAIGFGWDFSWTTNQFEFMGLKEDYEWFMDGVNSLQRSFLWEYEGAPATDIFYLKDHGVPTDGRFVGEGEIKTEFVLETNSNRILMTKRSWSYWNEENQDWNGNRFNGFSYLYNSVETYTYDPAHFHRTLEYKVMRLVGADWILGVLETHYWSENPNHAQPTETWRWQEAFTSYVYGPFIWDPNLDFFIYQVDTIRYAKFEPNSHKNIMVYHKYINYPGEEHQEGLEEIYSYNAAGGQIECWQYGLITEEKAEAMGLPTRFGIYWESIERDANNMPTKSRHRFCPYGLECIADDTEWYLMRVWEYRHENGYRVYQMGWRDEAMTITSLGGREIELDWDIPLSNVAYWPSMYLDGNNGSGNPWFPTKILSYTRLFVWDDGDPVRRILEQYYYSIIKDITSNEGLIIDGEKVTVVVFPNPVKDVLNIQTEDVVKQIFVFDLKGRLVFQAHGNQKSIDLSNLPAGHYVARIHTDKAIVPVRVVKQ